MSRARLAIVGCGAVVEQRYVYALRKLKWRPAALIDISPDRRKSVATMLSGKFVEAPSAAGVADSFDAAVVAVPHLLHEPLCVELLRMGKHVLVEKPMATTLASCAAMNAAAQDGKARLAVALMRHQAPALRWLKEALVARAFGRLKKFTIREGNEYNWPLTTDAMWRKEHAGGGVLMDTGGHTTDQIVWWFGEPDEVEYFDDSDGGVETNCLMRLRWADGLEGEVELSRTRKLSGALTLATERGQLKVGMTGLGLSAEKPLLAFTASSVGKPPFSPHTPPELFVSQMAMFDDYAQGGQANIVTGQDAAGSVSLIERCYTSRQPLEFPWIPYVNVA